MNQELDMFDEMFLTGIGFQNFNIQPNMDFYEKIQ